MKTRNLVSYVNDHVQEIEELNKYLRKIRCETDNPIELADPFDVVCECARCKGVRLTEYLLYYADGSRR